MVLLPFRRRPYDSRCSAMPARCARNARSARRIDAVLAAHALRRHRLAVRERDEPADMAIHVPGPRREADHPADEHETRNPTDREPEQGPPKRADHPAVMTRLGILIAADVVQ